MITGAGGQLGRSLLESRPQGIEVAAFDRAEFDLADDRECRAAVIATRPDLLINAAAYTNVDGAESDRAAAYRINASAPAALAAAMSEIGGRMVQVSTDFVFDGSRGSPYPVDAPCRPLNVYGESKCAAEENVLSALGSRALVVRTAWLYSSHGSNFVRTMLKLMSSRESVSVVCDQVGSPTWARSLALALWSAAGKPDSSGIMHWADAGVASWYDFAVAIGEEAVARGLLPRAVPVLPISTDEYRRQFPASVSRPAYSVLDAGIAHKTLGLPPVHWRTHLRAMLDELKA